ncbi:MAG TPA: copper amine oxidase N-terminal domain-containing protein [bacterium]
MVPLRGWARLMGARLSTRVLPKPASSRFELSFAGTTLEFEPNDTVALLDRSAYALPAEPTVQPTTGVLFVPLRTIADAFGLSYTWDRYARIFALRDPRLMDPRKLDEVDTFEEALGHAGPPGVRSMTDATEILPRNFHLESFAKTASGERLVRNPTYRITVTLEDVSAQGGLARRTRLYTLVLAYPHGILFKGGEFISYTTDYHSKDPCHLATSRLLRCVETFPGARLTVPSTGCPDPRVGCFREGAALRPWIVALRVRIVP